jgi:hypothetical protein
MKTIAIASLLALAACSGGSSGSGQPSLYGNWMYVDSQGTAGVGVSFKSDGTYVLYQLSLTSSSSALAEIETGTFTVSGNTITSTPEQWSCTGPDGVSSVSYSFSGNDLVITTASGIVSLQPDNATASDSFVITIGCFDGKTGAFTKQPLAKVSH